MSKYIDLECAICKIIFPRLLKEYKYKKKNCETYSPVCGTDCKNKLRVSKITVDCKNCGKIFDKRQSQVKEGNNFCSRSCSVSFNNQNVVRSNQKDKIKNCISCNASLLVKGNTPSSKVKCENCKIKKSNKIKINKTKQFNCLLCGQSVVLIKRSRAKYCVLCRHKTMSLRAIQRVNENKNNLKSISCKYPFNEKLIRCDSKAEYSCLDFVQRNYEVINISRSTLILEYELDGKIRRYNPDFLIELKGEQHLLVECKSPLSSKDLQRKWDIYYKSIIPKKIVLEKYCQDNNYKVLFYNKDMNRKFYRSLSRENINPTLAQK